MISSILGFWAVQPWVPDHPGRVRHRLSLVVWPQIGPVIDLTLPQALYQPLTRNILQAKQIIGRQFCVWVDVQVPPLEALPAYRRWPV